MTAPDVSVVVPCRNGALTIERALDSIHAQHVSSREIVVVDDGSSDDSVARVERWRREDVKLLRTSHQGVARARNLGIAEAAGEVVAFLDADDRWEPETLSLQVEALRSADVVFGDCTLMQEGRSPATFSDHVRQPSSPTLADLLSTRPVPLSTVASWKSTVTSYGGFYEDLESCEDYDLWYRMLLGGVRFARIPARLAIIDLRPEGLSRDLARYRRSMRVVLLRLLDDPRLALTDAAVARAELASLDVAVRPTHEST